MKALPKFSPDFLRVLCEYCSASGSAAECPVCEGKRYYLWDPESKYCFSANGDAIVLPAEGDEPCYLTRTESLPTGHLPLEAMIEVLGEWAREDSRRKFKLWFSDGSWHAELRVNRYEPGAFSVCKDDLTACVATCFERVLKLGNAD